MDAFVAALQSTLDPIHLAILLASTVVGVLIGAIPGLTVTMAIAIAVPMTVWIDTSSALMVLLGLYGSGIYGGSVSACLINAPGTPASAATCLDGYELARQGKGLKALKMALYASMVGGIFSNILLVLITPQLASFALKFGPAEICSLLVFALTVVAVLSGDSMVKGLLAATFGMLLATVGADPMLAVPRFTFGAYALFDGLAYIPMLIGLFAVAEMLTQSAGRFRSDETVIDIRTVDKDANRVTWADWKSTWLTMVRSSAIGSFIGILPGLGATIAAFMGYAEAKRVSKRPEQFGKGSIEGVAAAESANNAVSGSAMIPTLALGIPGDPPTAILLGALMIQGVTVGPLIYQNNPEVVYTIYIIMFLAIIAMWAVSAVALRPISMVLRVPKVLLFPIILAMCVAGSYAIRTQVFDVFVMLGAGLLGYVLRLFGVPVAPLLVAFILTRPFEEALRQTLTKSQGDPTILLTQPISALFLALAVVAVTVMVMRQRKKKDAVPETR